jgi:hypothetical protein
MLVTLEILDAGYCLGTSDGRYYLCRCIGRGKVVVGMCVSSITVAKRQRLSFENDFDVGPQEFSNVSIQKNKIHENEDAARRVENDAKLKEIIHT